MHLCHSSFKSLGAFVSIAEASFGLLGAVVMAGLGKEVVSTKKNEDDQKRHPFDEFML